MHETNRAPGGRPEISDGSPGIVIQAEPFGFYWMFWMIWVVLGVIMGTKVNYLRLESIELVELDLEPLLESWWMQKRRIRSGFTG